ncbi:MAG: BON domain-containing protein, partial [Acidobacteriota bacterium]
MRLLGVRGWSAAVLAGGMVLGTGALAQDGGQVQSSAAMSDAQVESNVLRALASAPELSTQNIETTTVYGVVTLRGNVQDEALRSKAENLAARAAGVKKVVDELALGAEAPDAGARGSALPGQPGQDQPQGAPQGQVLQSDGS